MSLVDFTAENAASELVTLDPTRTRCTCKKCAMLPPLPKVHCVKCHDSYTARTRGYPAFCAHCGYNLRGWRARNGIPEAEILLP